MFTIGKSSMNMVLCRIVQVVGVVQELNLLASRRWLVSHHGYCQTMFCHAFNAQYYRLHTYLYIKTTRSLCYKLLLIQK
jgi:hypothetical protein